MYKISHRLTAKWNLFRLPAILRHSHLKQTNKFFKSNLFERLTDFFLQTNHTLPHKSISFIIDKFCSFV